MGTGSVNGAGILRVNAGETISTCRALRKVTGTFRWQASRLRYRNSKREFDSAILG
ncbi:MAG: hypothetical protein NUW37_08715 [Planctomycetes bacterium]|nr:hypothetical protein [Planctomycetota bacterium]